jgi:hypothetical protein
MIGLEDRQALTQDIQTATLSQAIRSFDFAGALEYLQALRNSK